METIAPRLPSEKGSVTFRAALRAVRKPGGNSHPTGRPAPAAAYSRTGSPPFLVRPVHGPHNPARRSTLAFRALGVGMTLVRFLPAVLIHNKNRSISSGTIP